MRHFPDEAGGTIADIPNYATGWIVLPHDELKA